MRQGGAARTAVEQVVGQVAGQLKLLQTGRSKDARWLGLYKALIENGFTAEAAAALAEEGPRDFTSDPSHHEAYELQFALNRYRAGDEQGAMGALKRAARYRTLAEQGQEPSSGNVIPLRTRD